MTRPREWPFHAGLGVAAGGYAFLVAGTLAATALETTPGSVLEALRSPPIRAALRLSLVSSALATLLAMWAAVPLGYLLARVPFRGRWLVALLTDVPLVLPPTVVGVGLLLLSQTPVGQVLSGGRQVAYAVPAVVAAQFLLTAAFAAHGCRLVFARQSRRASDVARTLGATAGQAFWRVALPDARRELAGVAALSWARAVGEFGPVLVFAGAARFKTEVLPTTVYLELSAGNLPAACAVALLLAALGVAIVAAVRAAGGPP